ncbi:MAG: hypothetical protein KDK90_22835, partial [Leptospiraceae bacterium]|nr:hypothetical protein [Leptospiraceae bacterium]
VTDAALVSIAVTPGNQSIAKGLTQQYVATGTYTDGSTQNITTSVTWKSDGNADGADDSLYASVSNVSGSKGLATGTNQGTTVISASLSGKTGSTNLTVTSAALVSIAVTPANQTIETGQTQQYIATGTYTDSSTQVITTSVTWKSDSNSDGVDDSLIAGISNASGTKGLATGSSAGTTVISASLNGISGSTGLTVTTPQGVAGVGSYDVNLPSDLTEGTTPSGDYTGITYYNNDGVSGFVASVPESPATNCTEFGTILVGKIGAISGITSSQISNSIVGTSPNCSSIFLLDVTTSTSQKATDLSNTLIQEIGANVADGTVTALPVPQSGEASSTSFKVILQATYSGSGAGVVGVGVTNSADYAANEAVLLGFLDGTNVATSGSSKASTVDIFTGTADSKVDFVWVVDNSGSMAGEQTAVSDAATTFFSKLGNNHLDYRLGVLATGGNTCSNPSTPGYNMRSAGWVTSSTSNAQSTFTGTSGTTVGTSGCATESGIYMASRALGEGGTATLTPRSGSSWGSNYKLIFVMVSDEADQFKCYNGTYTSSNRDNYTNGPCYNSSNASFDNSNNVFKNNGYKVYNIIGLNSSGQPGKCSGSGTTSADNANNAWGGYYNLATATGGSSASICSSSFDSIMNSIVTQVAGSSSSYVLAHSAISSSISVKVNSVPVSQDATNGWTYNSSSKTIVFAGTAWPAQGSTIEISYEYYTSGGFAYSKDTGSNLMAYISRPENRPILIPLFVLIVVLGLGLFLKLRFKRA